MKILQRLKFIFSRHTDTPTEVRPDDITSKHGDDVCSAGGDCCGAANEADGVCCSPDSCDCE